jgi:pimeloyl-ACP methyl ester carboxylesterase
MPVEQLNDTTLHYEVTGGGEPLVLVHGAWVDLHNWDFVVPALAQSYQVIAYDLRGHGESSLEPPDAGDVHDDVADLVALVEHLGVAPVHVAGISSGAVIALRFACEHPQLVRSVLAHEPPLGASTATMRHLAEVQDLLSAGRFEEGAHHFVDEAVGGPGAWDALPPPVQSTFVRHARAFLGQLNDPDATEVDLAALAGLEVGILLSNGGASPPHFLEAINRILAEAPGCQRYTIPEAGHVPHMTHPADYVAMVREVLRA